jgi:hypothetical protein
MSCFFSANASGSGMGLGGLEGKARSFWYGRPRLTFRIGREAWNETQPSRLPQRFSPSVIHSASRLRIPCNRSGLICPIAPSKILPSTTASRPIRITLLVLSPDCVKSLSSSAINPSNPQCADVSGRRSCKSASHRMARVPRTATKLAEACLPTNPLAGIGTGRSGRALS